ncbi:Phosphoglucomutase-3 [Tulasnella sp. 332]|nr:Phosphoglucomutase-3 [Tulasnella sp. 332]
MSVLTGFLDRTAMVASTVSSKMVQKMAMVEGFRFVECLTGFKYIGNTALDLVKEGYEVPFGYEEAIGFMMGDEVRDKDGVAATPNAPFVSPSNARYPALLGGLPIITVRDLTIGHGYDNSMPEPDYKPALPLSSGQMITFSAADEKMGIGLTLTIRTSGTEPKIKYYLEGYGTDKEEVGKLLEGVVEELRTEWLEAKKNQLGEP